MLQSLSIYSRQRRNSGNGCKINPKAGKKPKRGHTWWSINHRRQPESRGQRLDRAKTEPKLSWRLIFPPLHSLCQQAGQKGPRAATGTELAGAPADWPACFVKEQGRDDHALSWGSYQSFRSPGTGPRLGKPGKRRGTYLRGTCGTNSLPSRPQETSLACRDAVKAISLQICLKYTIRTGLCDRQSNEADHRDLESLNNCVGKGLGSRNQAIRVQASRLVNYPLKSRFLHL